MSLVQALAESQTRLFLITRGAQPAGAPAALSMAQTPMCGLARVIVAEYPNLCPRQIDLCSSRPRGEARRLFEELTSACAETEVALRGGQGRFVQRLAPRSAPEGTAAQRPVAVHDHPCRVETTKPGVLDHLMLRAFEPASPGPGEVEIETASAALNFRDVMKALAIYPGDAPDAEQLGDECAGRIVAVGPGVTGFAVGDEVCAIARGAFASRVTTPAALVMRKPPRFTYEEAATVLVAFTTAYYALHHLAHMRAGERVLIHAATGGVGLAALQLARDAGAEVFATAGTPEKREFLKALGVSHVMDSRTLNFAAEIMEITGGSGVDIVLNSLAGEAIAKSLGCLGPYGRFLEIGKRDIYQNTRVGLRPFRNNLSYFAIDLGGALDPAMMSGFLKELRKRFNDHRLGPLPHRVFPLADFKSAFRHMAQAKQIGKLVLDFSGGKAPVAPAPGVRPVQFRAEATYLITGGLGGFGIATARWLVENGARHLVLTSRAGVPDAEAQDTLDALATLGARIVIEKSDVGEEAEVQELIGRIAHTMPPLAGVIHAAMVLDDGLLADLDAGRFRKVMAPKGMGAWNLHLHTRAQPLDFFVLYSSLSSVGGNLGQGNYAAANAFLDALAHHRRALGLPALAVNWGAIADTGYVARNHQMRDHLARQGWLGMESREALNALGRLMREQAVQTGVLRMDRSRNMASLPQLSLLATGPRADGDEAASSQAARESIAAAPAAERQKLIETVLAAQAGRRAPHRRREDRARQAAA